ncbi:oxidoreductase [Fimicolochytrium jonesii]|uniref:oxidoreductase n=1 Tax=Fimicolochytrium jonesii TaxID=1396493 RepID=UPI0022FED6B8|nr:oxidoreductase [Fimicolochytrium jonesii]KAI8821715.1 oxidoreductase [Fimicolochytrium jonesii]
MSAEQYKAGSQPPVQTQPSPGLQSHLHPQPHTSTLPVGTGAAVPQLAEYRGAEKLRGKVAVITGGDSGIGRAVAVLFAKEGADSTIVYLPEEESDAQETRKLVEAEGRRCLLIQKDVADEGNCKEIIDRTIKEYGHLEILVNNAATQKEVPSLADISAEQLDRTFKVNIYSQFFLCKHALPHLKPGSAIINTTSVNHYKGHPTLLDYTSTKGAIVAFTRSLALQLAEKGIRVNAVAPGPIWTPLIAATMTEDSIKSFGTTVPLKRPGQPAEVATSYVFLAGPDSTYISGQTLHPNGGAVVNG